MRVLIDTNVILDVIGKREPFYADSYEAMTLVYKKHTPLVSTTTITDFEDAVQAFAAKGKRAKLIITRNTKDYELSPVKAVTPSDFVAMVRRREKS